MSKKINQKNKSIAEVDQEKAKEREDFMNRARLADEALGKIQEKFKVKLSTKSRFQYLDEGISVASETIWLNNIIKK